MCLFLLPVFKCAVAGTGVHMYLMGAVSCCEITDGWALTVGINVILPFPGLSPFLKLRRA